jgi:Arc/MetJ family transcription regulator
LGQIGRFVRSVVSVKYRLDGPTPARTGKPPPIGRLPWVIFKRVGEGRPYPDHGYRQKDWADLPPRQVRLDQLVTTKGTLDLDALLDEDSTFYGDLFAHVVEWKGEMFLEDGLHRALRAALQQRLVLHARVLVLD